MLGVLMLLIGRQVEVVQDKWLVGLLQILVVDILILLQVQFQL